MDAAAARLTTAVGQVVDDLGDFVVERVKDLPQTIKEVSDRVSHAVTEGSERVRPHFALLLLSLPSLLMTFISS